MTKEERIKVYNKYGGRCAYCGQKIEYKDMQVDHAISQYTFDWAKQFYGYIWKERLKEKYHVDYTDKDDIRNLQPSCRLCNHYKRDNTIEDFREYCIDKVIERLMKVYIFRVALKYNLITINSWDKKFYFERLKEKEKENE